MLRDSLGSRLSALLPVSSERELVLFIGNVAAIDAMKAGLHGVLVDVYSAEVFRK